MIGGTGTCSVATTTACSWSAEASANWIVITSGQSGQGNGTIGFRVNSSLELNQREGHINLAQDGSARCVIRQAGVLGVAVDTDTATPSLTSHLDVPNARGQVIFDGAHMSLERGSRRQLAPRPAVGRHRVEAVLVSAAGKPGTWGFEVVGIRHGSLQVAAGTVVRLTGNSVVFRLDGRPGERIAFVFDTTP